MALEALELVVSNIKELLDNCQTEVSNKIENLKQEIVTLKSENQTLTNEVNDGHWIAFEYIMQTGCQMRELSNKADNLKDENAKLKAKIQRLENNPREVDKSKLENVKMEQQIKILENKIIKADTIKQTNGKSKNHQQRINSIESSQSYLNIQRIKQIERNVTEFINKYKSSIEQFETDAEKNNRRRREQYFKIRKEVGKYGKTHSVQQKFEIYKINYEKNRDKITSIVNSRKNAVMKIRNSASKCTLEIDNILEDIKYQTGELTRQLGKEMESVKKSIDVEKRLYEEISNVVLRFQNKTDCETKKHRVEKMNVSIEDINNIPHSSNTEDRNCTEDLTKFQLIRTLDNNDSDTDSMGDI